MSGPLVNCFHSGLQRAENAGIHYWCTFEMSGQIKSRLELTRHVSCPAPLRVQNDDKIVELFLNAFQNGEFAKNPHWMPQHDSNVEVIASAEGGMRLAIEHTRIFSFDGQPEQEKLLAPIARCLEAVKLPDVRDRWYQLYFHPNFIGRTLRKHQDRVLEGLRLWALRELPGLAPRDNLTRLFNIPVSLPDGRTASIKVDVEVWDGIQGDRQICVHGVLPSENRLVQPVCRALNRKLPKLAIANAELRFLLIEQPTITDSDNSILEIIREQASKFPLLKEIQAIAFAKTFAISTERVVFFSVWNVTTHQWCEYLRVNVT
ncbi:MAG: hypothetical protein JST79_19015 [Acidobacteria bacterium]|nr:hypothetical protein [Acidobacteriota bacterium]